MATKSTAQPEPAFSNLDGVVSATEVLLDDVTGPWSPLLFPSKVRTLVRKAWQELKPSITHIRGQLASAARGPHSLVTSGLTGSQLDLKLAVLTDTWRRFRAQGQVKLLASLVGVLKTIIESLAMSIPFAEALKEFLEFIERFLKGEDPYTAILDAA